MPFDQDKFPQWRRVTFVSRSGKVHCLRWFLPPQNNQVEKLQSFLAGHKEPKTGQIKTIGLHLPMYFEVQKRSKMNGLLAWFCSGTNILKSLSLTVLKITRLAGHPHAAWFKVNLMLWIILLMFAGKCVSFSNIIWSDTWRLCTFYESSISERQRKRSHFILKLTFEVYKADSGSFTLYDILSLNALWTDAFGFEYFVWYGSVLGGYVHYMYQVWPDGQRKRLDYILQVTFEIIVTDRRSFMLHDIFGFENFVKGWIVKSV